MKPPRFDSLSPPDQFLVAYPTTAPAPAAILAPDIAGYSRLMHEDEAATVRDLKAHQSVILPLIGRHGGRIIDTAGDGILAEFASVIGATDWAVEVQTVMAERNERVPESRCMLFRIDQPVRIYRLHIPGSSSGAMATPVRRPATANRRPLDRVGYGGRAPDSPRSRSSLVDGLANSSRPARREHRGAASLDRRGSQT